MLKKGVSKASKKAIRKNLTVEASKKASSMKKIKGNLPEKPTKKDSIGRNNKGKNK